MPVATDLRHAVKAAVPIRIITAPARRRMVT
jgi:hypothetical protein